MAEQDGLIAGKLEMPVEADLTGFEAKLKAGVREAAERVKAMIGVELDARQLKAELESKVREAAKGVKATIGAAVDAKELRGRLETAAEEASAAVSATIPVSVDVDALRAELEAAAKAASEGVTAKIASKVESVAADVVAAAAEGQAAADANPVEVPVDLDEKQVLAKLRLLLTKMQAEANRNPVNLFAGFTGKGGLGGKGVIRGLLYGGIAALIQPAIALIGQSVAALASMTSSLSPMVGLLGALPGLITAVVGPLMAGKMAFSGWTEAIGNYVKAQEALKKQQAKNAESNRDLNKTLGSLPTSQRRAAREVARMREEGVKTEKQQDRLNKLLKDMSPAAKAAARDVAALGREDKKTAELQKALADSMKDISPSAKTAAFAVLDLRDDWKALKVEVQESMFSRFFKEIGPAATRGIPLLSKGLSGLSGVVGDLAGMTLRWTQTPLFRNQLSTIFSDAERNGRAFTTTAVSMGKALMNTTVAAIPLTDRIADATEKLGKWVEAATSGGAASLRMRAFFKDAGDTAAQAGRILGATGKGLFGVFRGGRDAGDNLLDLVERRAAKFAAWANSERGFASIKSYFDDAVPGARQVAGLIGDIVRALGRLSRDGALESMVGELRKSLIPALEELLSAFGRALGPQVIRLISQVAILLANLSEAASPLSILVGVLARMVQDLNWLVDTVPGLGRFLGVLLSLIAAMKVLQVLTRMGGATAGLVKWFGDLTRLSGPVGTFTTRVKDLGAASGRLGGLSRFSGFVSGAWTGALAAGSIALGLWMDSHAQAQARVEELTASLDKQTGALTGNSRTVVANALTKKGMFGSDSAADLTRKLGLNLETVTDAALGSAGAMEQLNYQLGDNADLSGENLDNWLAWGALQDKISKASGEVQQSQQKWRDMKVITGDAATVMESYSDATRGAADETEGLGVKSQGAGTKLNGLRSALSQLIDGYVAVPQATASVKQSIAGITKELIAANVAYIKNNGALDLNAEKGRELQNVLISSINDLTGLADATYATTGSAKEANAAWNRGIRALITQMVKMGLTEAAAMRLAEAYGAIPNMVKTKFIAEGIARVKNGLTDIYSYMLKINGKKVKVDVTRTRGGDVQFQNTEIDKYGRKRKLQPGMARGGLVPYGLGGPTQDNVMTPLSSGEYVVDAENTRKWRMLLAAIDSGSTSMVKTVARQVAGTRGTPTVRPTRPAARASKPDYAPTSTGGEGSGRVLIVDADGRLIGAMRTASQQTAQQRDAADRLSKLSGWAGDQL